MKNAIQQGSLLDMPALENKEMKPSQPVIEKKMSRLEELIAKFCPNGVEYKPLGELCTIYDGTHQTPKYTTSGVKFVSVENIDDLYSSKKYISIEDYEKNYKIKPQKNDIFMTRIGTIGACTVVNGSEPLAYYVTLTLIRPNQNEIISKYVKYIIESKHGRKELWRRTLVNASPIKINLGEIGKIKIPVPPLPVQEEIVRILDTFSELTAELTAELTKRKQQYQYYRDNLLELKSDTVQWKSFGSIASIVRGASPRPISQYVTDEDDGVNWIKIGDVSTGSKYVTSTKEKITRAGAKKSRFVKEGDFILSNSMSFGRPYIMKTSGCIHDGWLSISQFETTYLSDFLYHLLNSSFVQKAFSQKASSGTVQNLNADIVKSIELPIPPLQEQKRIVAILDRFDALCNDLTSGLPAEIEARKKQYEYYRDKLLTFKEAV